MMKKLLKHSLLVVAINTSLPLYSEELTEKTSSTKFYKKPASPSKKIWFQFKAEPLSEVINYLAQIMKINVVLPAGDDILSQTLTFQLPEKITIAQAWDHVLTILKVTGYSVIDQNNFYYVKKNSPSINKEPLPLFIQTPADQLPNDDQRIRMIYYFSNINVGSAANAGGGGGTPSSLTTILQNILSPTANFMVETSMNAVIISDYSRNIRSALSLLEKLDVHGPTDHVMIVKLAHTNATMVAQLFQQLIPSASPQTQNDAFSGSNTPTTTDAGNGPIPMTANSPYFSQSTRIVAVQRSNSLILMGRREALEHIKNFIKTNIDIELKKGESVVHIYNLEYMDAQTLAPILQNIVSSQASNNQSGSSGAYGSGTGQSTTTGTTPGYERFFNGVIIMAEPVSQASSGSGSGSQSTWWSTADSVDASASTPPPAQRGGNRLIIAATQEDWIRIKKLIKEMDIPQPQIALEVLVVDLTLTGLKVLGSQLRDLTGLRWNSLHGQTSNLGTLVVEGNPNPTAANALQSDLLEPYNPSGTPANATLANQATAGSLIMALRDQGTNSMWWVSQLLRSSQYAKVLAQPFAIALNNQQTTFGTTDNRILPGNATVVKGANVVQLQQITATINLVIQPRISENGNINLGLNISITQFSSADQGNGNQNSRQITTNANVKDGEVLILGGLTKNKLSAEELEVPVLGKIPIIKWFFARKQKTTTQENLMVFICAKKMTPSTNAFYDIFTGDKIAHATSSLESHGETFESLRDPINRWFFGSQGETASSNHMQKFHDRHMFEKDHKYKEEYLQHHGKTEEQIEKDPGITQDALNKEQDFYNTLIQEYIGQAEPAKTPLAPAVTHTIATNKTSVKQPAQTAPVTAPAILDSEEEQFKKMLEKLPMPS